MSKGLILLNGRHRAAYGCTTTWRNEGGELLTAYRGGPPYDAMRGLIDDLAQLDPTYRLVCYSTPETIFRDLTVVDTRRAPDARSPESAVLSYLGRSDLLHSEARASFGDKKERGGNDRARHDP